MSNNYSNNGYEPEYEDEFKEELDVQPRRTQAQPQRPVQRPVQRQSYDDEMTIGSWLLTFLITYIPVVGWVMVFVWAFGDGNQTRATFMKALLVWSLIAIGLGFVFLFMLGGMAAMLS